MIHIITPKSLSTFLLAKNRLYVIISFKQLKIDSDDLGMDMDIWQPIEINAGTHKGQVGPLVIWLRRQQDEIHIAYQRPRGEPGDVESLSAVQDPTPYDLDWGRWIVGDTPLRIQWLPVMPDRTVVVLTESPVNIPPEKEAVFFVSIPIWIRIQIPGPKPIELCEIPTVIRSNIWFGDTVSGELCYSLISRARRQAEDADHPLYKAVCPVKIRNKAKTLLEVERFCVHVQHLNVFTGVRHLWTNEITITFQGQDRASKIDYARQPPTLEPDLQCLTPARKPLKESLFKRSLGGVTHLTEIKNYFE